MLLIREPELIRRHSPPLPIGKRGESGQQFGGIPVEIPATRNGQQIGKGIEFELVSMAAQIGDSLLHAVAFGPHLLRGFILAAQEIILIQDRVSVDPICNLVGGAQGGFVALVNRHPFHPSAKPVSLSDNLRGRFIRAGNIRRMRGKSFPLLVKIGFGKDIRIAISRNGSDKIAFPSRASVVSGKRPTANVFRCVWHRILCF